MKFYCLLILCISYLPVYPKYTLHYITNGDGLSNNSVNCIYEDSDHVMWFGTWDGLNAFNGREIEKYRYNKNDPHSISNNIIRIILEQDKDNLWVSTDAGLNRWNRRKQTFDRFFCQYAFPLIGVTAEHRLICGIRSAGLFFFDEPTQRFIKIESETPIGHTKKMCIDSNNTVYQLSYEGELYTYTVKYAGGKPFFTGETLLYTKESGIADMDLSDGKLILNCRRSLKIIDIFTSRIDSIRIPHGKGVFKTAYANRTLIVTYTEGGYEKFNTDTGQQVPLEDLADGVSVFSMYMGSQDILWIGTDGQGVITAYEYTSPFRTVATHHPVRSFCEDSRGNLLIGTKGEGMKVIDKKSARTVKSLTMLDGLNSNSVYAFAKNKNGDIFIGGDGEGLNILYHNSDRIERLRNPRRYPPFQSVYSMLFTRNDSTLWLGAVNLGLIGLDIKKEESGYVADGFEQYTLGRENTVTNNTIYALVRADTANEFWLGTRGGGVNKYTMQTKQFDRLDRVNENLMNRDILSLLYESEGEKILWSGTSYGLNKIRLSSGQPSLYEYTDINGLANNTIHGILQDRNKNLWVSTNYGLSFINRQTNEIINYTTRNGLHNNEFSDNAFYQDSDGLLYFGGVGGFTYFDPDEIYLRNYAPEIKLVHLRINNENQNIYDRITDNLLKVSYEESYLTLSFIAREFINNRNCKYKYRILHFAEEWINNEENANVILTKLPPGKYELQVKCTNGDGVWSDTVYKLSIQAGYPWWGNPVAYTVYACVLLALLYFVWSIIKNRMRLKQQILFEQIDRQHTQKLYESKLNFFTNVAHEFFTPLTLIYGPAQHLLEKGELNGYSKRYVQIIKNNADRMQKLINELMEFRKAESGYLTLYAEPIDMPVFIEYIADSYMGIAEEKKIDLKVNIQDLTTFVSDRNSLEKIFSNLFSNAFKYTPAGGYIHAAIRQHENKLYFEITNSGKGLTDAQMERIFDRFRIFETSRLENGKSTGVGLNLTKNLLDLLHGEIKVSSRLNEYVTFSVVLNPLSLQQATEITSVQEPEPESALSETERKLFENTVTILLVEDERNIRRLLRDILLPAYRVEEAEDGEEGLDIIRKNRPDIIITDILMPGMDGIELINAVKSDPQTAHIPIIGISAKNAIEDKIKAYKHGADLYIAKPFHPQHVLTTVANILARHSVLKDYFNSSRASMKVIDGLMLHEEENELIQRIITFIRQNIDDDSLTPNSLSDFLSISRASLFKKVKDLTNRTPGEFIRAVRLEYASKLLVTTRCTVSEIMYKSGFSHKSYFYKEFAKQFNMSPKEYRDKHTEKKE